MNESCFFVFMQIFVSVALKTCEELGIADKKGQSMVMRFAKIYPVNKIVEITLLAKTYPWHEKNPTAAFMKAVGETNKKERGEL